MCDSSETLLALLAPHTRWRLPPKVFGPDSEDSPGGRARRFKSVNFKNVCFYNTGCLTSVYVNSFPVQNTWTNCLSFIRVTSRAYQVSPWSLGAWSSFGRVFPCKQADFPQGPRTSHEIPQASSLNLIRSFMIWSSRPRTTTFTRS